MSFQGSASGALHDTVHTEAPLVTQLVGKGSIAVQLALILLSGLLELQVQIHGMLSGAAGG